MIRQHLFESFAPEAAYFLGAMAADGNVYGNRPKLDQANEAYLESVREAVWPEATVTQSATELWELRDADGSVVAQSPDQGHLDDIQRVLLPKGSVHRVRQALFSLRRHDDWLVAWLAEHGVVERKSSILRFPPVIPPDRLRDYVRGLIDGDGSVYIHNYRQTRKGVKYTYQYGCVALYSGSEAFIGDFSDAVRNAFDGEITLSTIEKECGGTACVPTSGIVYVARLGGWSAYKFLRWLYYEPELLCLARKRQVAEQILAIYANPEKRDVDVVNREIQEATDLRRIGYSYGMIAVTMNISRERAKNHCRSARRVEATYFLPGRRTDPALIEECRQLRREGNSLNVISDLTGVHPATVSDNVRDIAVETRVSRYGNEDERKAGIQRILELGKLGWTETMIAEETGASVPKVRKWLRTIPDRLRTHGKRKQMNDDIRRCIVKLSGQGMSLKNIAAMVDRSYAVVKKTVAAHRNKLSE